MAEADSISTVLSPDQMQVDESTGNSQSDIKSLSNFVVNRILSNNPQRKTVFVEGIFKDKDGKAVLLLEKQAFNENFLTSLSGYSELQEQFVNDIYGNYECFADPKINSKCRPTPDILLLDFNLVWALGLRPSSLSYILVQGWALCSCSRRSKSRQDLIHFV